MSYHPTHLVLFHSDKDVSREQILRALEGSYNEISIDGNGIFHVHDIQYNVDARAHYSDEPYVLAESWEIADEFATERPDREYIAGCDRRFEVSADADDQMLYFNIWLRTTERLQALVQGVVFDPTDGTFF